VAEEGRLLRALHEDPSEAVPERYAGGESGSGPSAGTVPSTRPTMILGGT